MYVLTSLIAAVGVLALTPAVIRFARMRSLYDVPTSGRHVHTTPVPRLGGLAIFASTLLALSLTLWSEYGAEYPGRTQAFYLAVLLGGGGLALIGLVDDVVGLRARTKVLAQIAAGTTLYALGLRIDSLAISDGLTIEFGIFALPLTVLWVVLVTNALNLIDGLDGLASGIAVIALASITTVAYALGRTEIVVVGLAVLGALLGFLRYNFRPARIFLGDCGSLFVGFVLAALSIAVAGHASTAVLGLAPLFALALPLADTTLSFTRRWLRGLSWADADRRHIHHQLLARGIPHMRAVLMLYVVASCVAAVGLLAAFAPATLVTVASVAGAAAAIGLLVWGLDYLDYHEFAEAVRVALSAPARLRRVIREQIHARDVARVLEVAGSLEELNAVLADNAEGFGFLHMEVSREGERSNLPAAARDPRVPTSVLHHPVRGAEPGTDPFVLRVWCRSDLARPFGASRVVGVFAPVIGARLALIDVPPAGPAVRTRELPFSGELVSTAEPQRYRFG
jgi:UDP-GlcNAc:undecaprenyl-phosphate GlcNAc-1-phosphate transferase